MDTRIYDFKEHPFHVVEDSALFELAKSILTVLLLPGKQWNLIPKRFGHVKLRRLSYCEDLPDVVIGANNTEIGTYSFYDCTALVNVSIAAESESDELKIVIDDKAFQCSSAQNVLIGRCNVELWDNAFSYCEDLVSVGIKGILSDIGDYAFYDCPAELVISYNGSTYNKKVLKMRNSVI